MLQLALLVAVLAALALAEGAPGLPLADPLRTLVGTGLLLGTLASLAWGGSAALVARLRSEPKDRADCRRWFERLERVHFALWTVAAIVVLYFLEWPRLVRANFGLAGAFLVDELLLLAPVLLPPLVAWAAFYDVELALVRATEAVAGVASPPPPDWLTHCWLRLQFVAFQARQSLGLALVPALALVALHDGVELLSPGVSKSAWAALIYLPPLLAAAAGAPLLFRLLWPTRPLEPGSLRERLEAVAAKAGYPIGEVLIWETEETQANAAIIGFLPQLRYVLLSDLLLELLDDDEVEAVFRHELAHLEGGHLWLRLGVLAAPVCLCGALLVAIPSAAPAIETSLAGFGIASEAMQTILWPGVVTTYCVLALGWYSRSLEHEADLTACQELDAVGGDKRLSLATIAHLSTALERLTLATGADRRAATWLHPSLDDRLAILAQAAGGEESAAYVGRRLQWIAGGIVGAIALAAILFLAAG